MYCAYRIFRLLSPHLSYAKVHDSSMEFGNYNKIDKHFVTIYSLKSFMPTMPSKLQINTHAVSVYRPRQKKTCFIVWFCSLINSLHLIDKL